MTIVLTIIGVLVFALLLYWGYWQFHMYDPRWIVFILVVGAIAFALDTYISYASTFLEEPTVRVATVRDHLLFRDGLRFPRSKFPIDPRIIYHGAWILTVISLVVNKNREQREQAN